MKIFIYGFGSMATHTKKTKRFDTKLDTTNKVDFNFEDEIF